MNNQKICFIMCSNDETLANECLLYIEQLIIPKGFSTETLIVRDAASMTSGYNAAMHATDAKYKIYLHQDVFLIYKNILIEIVDLFIQHPDIGMIGTVGNTSLADDGCQWSDGLHRRIGELLGDLITKTTYSMFGKATGEYQPVLVLDGLFMATQYDIPWREDIFGGWDFYDSSQSLEFWKAGYQVIVPYMNAPWCLHDNDIPNLANYEKWQKIFQSEYKSIYLNNFIENIPTEQHRKIALCVPTLNHPEVVNDVLQNCISDYQRYGIDIYYYDSSEDDKTLNVIKSFQNRGFNNLYYIKVSSDYSFDDKIELIYNGYGWQNSYEYIWPAKDRSFCPAPTLICIIAEFKNQPDFILLCAGFDNITSRCYTIPSEFYADWAWLATSLDVVIYKYSTILKDYDSHTFNQIHNQDYIESWRVYVFIFNKLAEQNIINVSTLTGSDIAVYNSPLGKSTWTNNVFKIWKDYWIKANEDLPDCYNKYKNLVIKKATSLPWILGTTERLIELHDLNALTSDNLTSIEKDWEKVSNIPVEKLRQIACGTFNQAPHINNQDKTPYFIHTISEPINH